MSSLILLKVALRQERGDIVFACSDGPASPIMERESCL